MRGSGGARFYQSHRGGGPPRHTNAHQYQRQQRGDSVQQRQNNRAITYDSAAEESFHSWYNEARTTTPNRSVVQSRSSTDRDMLHMNLMMDERGNTQCGGGGGGASYQEKNFHNTSCTTPTGPRSRSGSSRILTTSARNLIVNYLPQTFTDKDLFNLFICYGPIQSVKIMKEYKSGYSFGFGFVNFHNDSDALNAMNALNGMPVQNKRLKVSLARPPSDEIKDTNVFITNLPRHYDEQDMFELFAPFGDIVQNHILRDKETQQSRGAAFVRFDLREQASRAINAMNGFIPEGGHEPLRVKLAQDHGKQKAAYLAGFKDAMLRRRPAQGNLQADLFSPPAAH